MLGGAESSRDYFSGVVNLVGASAVVVLSKAGRRANLTRCSVSIIAVGAAGTVTVQSTTGIVVFAVPSATIDAYSMSPLYKGILLPAGDNVEVVRDIPGTQAWVTVEGYWTLI